MMLLNQIIIFILSQHNKNCKSAKVHNFSRKSNQLFENGQKKCPKSKSAKYFPTFFCSFAFRA